MPQMIPKKQVRCSSEPIYQQNKHSPQKEQLPLINQDEQQQSTTNISAMTNNKRIPFHPCHKVETPATLTVTQQNREERPLFWPKLGNITEHKELVDHHYQAHKTSNKCH